MSLINEALKRARDASCQGPQPSHVGPAYQPVMTPPSMSTSSTIRHATWLILAGIVIGVATLMLWNRKHSAPLVVAPANANTVAMQPVTPEPVTTDSPAPIPVVATVPVTEPVPAAIATLPAQDVKPLTVDPVQKIEPAKTDPLPVAEVVVTPVPSPATVVVTAPLPPPPPTMKLQAVMMHGAMRQAIINGQTVQAGDKVDGADVVRIEQRTVVLRWHNTDITLRMP